MSQLSRSIGLVLAILLTACFGLVAGPMSAGALEKSKLALGTAKAHVRFGHGRCRLEREDVRVLTHVRGRQPPQAVVDDREERVGSASLSPADARHDSFYLVLGCRHEVRCHPPWTTSARGICPNREMATTFERSAFVLMMGVTL